MSTTETSNEALAHFGVKGMRWGVRKDTVKSVAKGTVRVVLKTAKTTGKVALASAGLAAVGGAALLSADPDFQNTVSVGKDYTKLMLDDAGLLNMSHLDKAGAVVNIKTYELENKINN